MKILVLGGGGREHALSHTFHKQGHSVYCIPGNGGTQKICEHVDRSIDINDFDQIALFAKEKEIDLTVCGPEALLEKGIADTFLKYGLKFFGPTKIASQIECSKVWSKDFMFKYGIPTGRYVKCRDIHDAKKAIKLYFNSWSGVVVKPSGLTSGKGVVVSNSVNEAEEAVKGIMEDKKYGEAGKELIIEEVLQGKEVSIIAFCDGKKIIPMIPVQDHKRLYDGSQGPNTGGIGACSLAPFLSEEMVEKIKNTIIDRTAYGLLEEGISYIGFLYFGIILTSEGPKLLEYNCRFGDPEAQVIFPLLKSDLASILLSCCEGNANSEEVLWENQATCCVVMVSRGYPKSYQIGYPIKGLENVENDNNVWVFHGGTTINEKNQLITTGGRVLAVTSIADDLEKAISICYDAVKKIDFHGSYYRLDIGRNADT